MNIKQNLVATSKYNIKCPYVMNKPSGIIIHETYNNAPAVNEVKYMITNNKKVSFHIAVDDVEAIQGIPFNRGAYHCGNTNGNKTFIGLEICYSKNGGPRYEKAKQNAIKLTAQLCKQFGFTTKEIKQHYDVSKKDCPHRMRAEGKWNWFISEVQKELHPPKPVQPPSQKPVFFKVGSFERNVVVTADNLNIRKGRGTEHVVLGSLKKGQVVKVNYIHRDNSDGKGSDALWGSIPFKNGVNGMGYIHLDYVVVK